MSESTHAHSGETHSSKKGGFFTKYKWYFVGGVAILLVLLLYISRKNAANSGTTAQTVTGQAAGSGIDPTTGLPYASEYGSYPDTSGSGGGTGATGATGPAGPAGPAGPKGATGAAGKAASTLTGSGKAPITSPAKPATPAPTKTVNGQTLYYSAVLKQYIDAHQWHIMHTAHQAAATNAANSKIAA